MRARFIVTLAILVLLGCSHDNTEPKAEDRVARAGDEYLDRDEYTANFISTGIVKDSLYNARKVIERWAIESLFYQEAVSRLTEEEMLIEKQVEDFRRSLVNYMYQTKVIEVNLDTVVTWEEIEDYYNQHRSSFILKDNILKVNYFKVPVKAQALAKIRKLIWSANPKDREQLELLCSQNAENYFMNDSTWLFLDDVKKEVPALKDQPEFALHAGKVFEFQDEMDYYYLKIKEVKVKNSFSPIHFEGQNIRKFILNNRKTQLITQYKQSLLEKAKSEKSFTVFGQSSELSQ